jgi:hypothetical protein
MNLQVIISETGATDNKSITVKAIDPDSVRRKLDD